MDLLALATLAAVLGTGLMAGVFFAFSTFVMEALRRVPDGEGMRAMQSINLVVLRSPFLPAFLATAALSALLVVAGLLALPSARGAWLAAAGAAYVAGGFGVTIARNVPLNERLATADPQSDAGRAIWALYLDRWLFWNHVRTAACAVAALGFAMALA